jgi:hypothetical protein
VRIRGVSTRTTRWTPLLRSVIALMPNMVRVAARLSYVHVVKIPGRRVARVSGMLCGR